MNGMATEIGNDLKPGDRVTLSARAIRVGLHRGLRKRMGRVTGEVIGLCRSGNYKVRVDGLKRVECYGPQLWVKAE